MGFLPRGIKLIKWEFTNGEIPIRNDRNFLLGERKAGKELTVCNRLQQCFQGTFDSLTLDSSFFFLASSTYFSSSCLITFAIVINLKVSKGVANR